MVALSHLTLLLPQSVCESPPKALDWSETCYWRSLNWRPFRVNTLSPAGPHGRLHWARVGGLWLNLLGRDLKAALHVAEWWWLRSPPLFREGFSRCPPCQDHKNQTQLALVLPQSWCLSWYLWVDFPKRARAWGSAKEDGKDVYWSHGVEMCKEQEMIWQPRDQSGEARWRGCIHPSIHFCYPLLPELRVMGSAGASSSNHWATVGDTLDKYPVRHRTKRDKHSRVKIKSCLNITFVKSIYTHLLPNEGRSTKQVLNDDYNVYNIVHLLKFFSQCVI